MKVTDLKNGVSYCKKENKNITYVFVGRTAGIGPKYCFIDIYGEAHWFDKSEIEELEKYEG